MFLVVLSPGTIEDSLFAGHSQKKGFIMSSPKKDTH